MEHARDAKGAVWFSPKRRSFLRAMERKGNPLLWLLSKLDDVQTLQCVDEERHWH